jgi:hypothetical protein
LVGKISRGGREGEREEEEWVEDERRAGGGGGEGAARRETGREEAERIAREPSSSLADQLRAYARATPWADVLREKSGRARARSPRQGKSENEGRGRMGR